MEVGVGGGVGSGFRGPADSVLVWEGVGRCGGCGSGIGNNHDASAS